MKFNPKNSPRQAAIQMKFIPKDHIHEVCLIGKGEKCCAYLVAVSGGIACAKGTQAAYHIELELAEGRRYAKGDNCRGITFELIAKGLEDDDETK